jgi:hypothetical protein
MHRREGFATTHYGKFGIPAIKDITLDHRKKIVIWGDSYVQARMVNDDEKIPQVLTARLSENGLGNEFMSFGVGLDGNSVADYYFDIPAYESLNLDIVSHVILITGISDTLPGLSDDFNMGVFRANPLRFEWNEWTPDHTGIKQVFKKFKLNFLWWVARSASLRANDLHLLPIGKAMEHGEITIEKKEEVVYSRQELIDAWSFLFEKLREQTKLPIVFVYSPPVPGIKNGKVSLVYDEEDKIELFAEVACKFNIQVLNTAVNFISFYKKNQGFPRGFANTTPSNGHLNRDGQKIVADTIMNHILETKSM